MKKLFALLCLAAVTVSSAQTPVSDDDLINAYQSRKYTMRAVCHDPSIVIDDITSPSSPVYYIYGSHLGRGKTTAAENYQKWTSFKAGEESNGTPNSLFADDNGNLVNFRNAYDTPAVKTVTNYKGETVDFCDFNAHSWQYTGNSVKGMQWAPDVIYNKNGEMVYVYERQWRQLVFKHSMPDFRQYRGSVEVSGSCRHVRIFGKIQTCGI